MIGIVFWLAIALAGALAWLAMLFALFSVWCALASLLGRARGDHERP